MVPTDIRLDDPAAPHFEGELKGAATEGSDRINAIFETVAVPAVAAKGGGTVTAYLPDGVFAGHLEVHLFESPENTQEAAGATVDFDLTF